MSARGPKKYYDVHRRFDERDAHAHLAGDRTKGATLRYPEGKTRALCYDADTTEDWQCLQEAARILARSGYLPLLEASPVGRGGHLWIIFTDLVRAGSLRSVSCPWHQTSSDTRVLASFDVQSTAACWHVCEARLCLLVHAH